MPVCGTVLPVRARAIESLTRLGSDSSTRFTPGKGCREANTDHKRIQITIETEHVLTIRTGSGTRLGCQKCGCEVDVADLLEVKTSMGIAQPTLPACVESFGTQDESVARVADPGCLCWRSLMFIFRWCEAIRSSASKRKLRRTS
jgi:hypothetical protein